MHASNLEFGSGCLAVSRKGWAVFGVGLSFLKGQEQTQDLLPCWGRTGWERDLPLQAGNTENFDASLCIWPMQIGNGIWLSCHKLHQQYHSLDLTYLKKRVTDSPCHQVCTICHCGGRMHIPRAQYPWHYCHHHLYSTRIYSLTFHSMPFSPSQVSALL